LKDAKIWIDEESFKTSFPKNCFRHHRNCKKPTSKWFNFITCFNDELRKKLLSQPPNINLSKHVIFKTILRKP
jgi:hypothetical protein